MTPARTRVAVVGAGIGGAACARWMADAGLAVEVFDKSRGVGGRMSTRRAAWIATDGTERPSHFDHGASGFTAHAPEFIRFVEQAAGDGLLSRWAPRVAPNSDAPPDASGLWVPTPDMPTLSSALLADLPLHTGCTVEALRRTNAGWTLEGRGSTIGEAFAAVVIAMPLPQAAVLVRPHQAEWAQRAEAVGMLPGWVLMGVSDEPAATSEWDLAWPVSGPLASVVRNDAKPGREPVRGLAHWVVHATPEWSQTHLESPAAEVQAALQGALTAWLGHSLAWHHAVVHRWRYASVPRPTHAGAPSAVVTKDGCWWDSRTGLGVCADALGGAGVEGAWYSARALADHITDQPPGSQTPCYA